MSKNPERWHGDELGMSDAVVSDERDAIGAVKKAFATFCSELQDSQAKITSRGNKRELDDILSELSDLQPDYDDMETTLQEARDE